MRTNFSVNSFKTQQYTNKLPVNTNHLAAKNFGLPHDTFVQSDFVSEPTFSGKMNKKVAGGAAAALLALGSLFSCNSTNDVEEADTDKPVDDVKPIEEVVTVPEPEIDIPVDNRAEIDTIFEDYNLINNVHSPYKWVTFNPEVTEQTIITPGEANLQENRNNKKVASTIREIISKDYPLEVAFEKAKVDISGINDASIDGAFHNTIDELLQSNPKLAAAVYNINGVETREALAKLADDKGVSYYDLVADTVLSEFDEYEDLDIVLPKFSMPLINLDKTDYSDVDFDITMYSSDVNRISIDNKKSADELGDDEFNSFPTAVANNFDLNTNDSRFDEIINKFAFVVANNPKNIDALGEEARALSDNGRKDLLLSMDKIDNLYIPSRILIGNVGKPGENDRLTDTHIYQVSPSSLFEGEKLNGNTIKLELPASVDFDNLPIDYLGNLDSVLKFYTVPGRDLPMSFMNNNGDFEINLPSEGDKDFAISSQSNFITNNIGIFTALQTIDNKLEMFGAFDVVDEQMQEIIAEEIDIQKDILTEDADPQLLYASVRNSIIKEYVDGDFEKFLADFCELNFDRALNIEFYDPETGELRFKNTDGSPVTVNISEFYVNFPPAKVNKPNRTVLLISQ